MAARLDYERAAGLAVAALVLVLAVALMAAVHLLASRSAAGLAGGVALLMAALGGLERAARRRSAR
jgi:hypothetical protein